MIQKVRETEKAVGTGEKVMHPVEAELRGFAPRSIFTLRDIAVGEEFTRENIAVLRSGNLKAGLEPKRFREIPGKRALWNIPAESAIQSEDYA